MGTLQSGFTGLVSASHLRSVLSKLPHHGAPITTCLLIKGEPSSVVFSRSLCLDTGHPDFSMLGPSFIILALGAFISTEASIAQVSAAGRIFSASF